MDAMIVTTTLLTTCVKLLLVPCYRSTDFEVHRNWLAITHSLPIKRWYYEDTSEWTLDYPPLFAWFEYLLSFVAYFFDKEMLKVENLNYASEKTVLFQRLSVIFTDLVYVFGVHRISGCLPKGWKKDVVFPILCLTNCGLIMVDHIHFQYNGIMYGILLISIAHLMKGEFKRSAFWFTFLINMKHIYVYLAPAYFVYLLRHNVLAGPHIYKNIGMKSLKNLIQLGAIVVGVFAISLLPFLGHLPQLFSRLFPFKRGLSHAYWAPNVWAIYNSVDKIATILVPKLTSLPHMNSTASMTGGLVQEFSHAILPSISPLTTILLTLFFMLPCMLKLFMMNKVPFNFLRCLVLCALTSFLFGWHVHEKAILMAIIPLSIVCIMEPMDAKIFLILSTVGHYSLFPLLFPIMLIPLKVSLLVLYTTYSFYCLCKIHSSVSRKYVLPLLNIYESVYIVGLSGVFMYENIVHTMLGLDAKLPFLPLMFTSFYCALGVVYCWVKYYVYFLKISGVNSGNAKNKKL